GRTRDVVNEEKENADAEVSTKDVLSTSQQKVSTDIPKVSTDGSKVSTDKEKDSTDRTDEGTDDQTEGRRATQTIQTTTSTMFGDDETIAQVLLNMSQAKAVYLFIKEMNEKGIDSLKNESVKEVGKEEEGTKKRKSGYIKMVARKRPRKQTDDDSDDEHKKCLKIVTFEATIDSEIMEKKSVITRLDKVSSPDGVYLMELEDGIVIHMLVERRYPLSKDLLQRMLHGEELASPRSNSSCVAEKMLLKRCCCKDKVAAEEG
ncbi:hypothetical protein Tco_1526862, partial [Tanacetum coccineum]